jgi:hypothetical protein
MPDCPQVTAESNVKSSPRFAHVPVNRANTPPMSILGKWSNPTFGLWSSGATNRHAIKPTLSSGQVKMCVCLHYLAADTDNCKSL